MNHRLARSLHRRSSDLLARLRRSPASATALFARGTFSATRKAQIRAAHRAVADALPMLDFWHMLNAEDETQATLNWAKSAYPLTKVNTPTFTAGQGYKGDGSTGRLTTAFTPSTAGGNMTLNSATIGCMVLDVSAVALHINLGATSGSSTYIGGGGGAFSSAINAATNPTLPGTIANIGLMTVVRRDASTADVYIGRHKVTTASATAATALSSSIMTYLSGTGAYYSPRIVSGGFVGGAMTDAQVAAMADAMHADMKATGGYYYARIVTCLGNSLTFGQGASSAAMSYPGQLATLYTGSTGYAIREGYSGETSQQLLARLSTTMTIRAHSQMPTAKRIAVIWEMRNDIVVNGIGPTQAVDNLKALCIGARLLGFDKIVVCNVIADGYAGGVGPAAQAAVNAELLARYSTFADGHVDLASAPELSTPTDTTYYNADKLHLTDAGYAVVAARVKAVTDTM